MPQIGTVQNFHSDVSDKIYFWTATINQWFPLLQNDENKQVIVDSLKYLSDGKYISVFGFVIMPTHIHLIWKQNKLNGRETPQGSFLKYTAHILLDRLMKENKLAAYVVDKSNKRHEIWQNNPLGIEIFSKEMALQKLNYVHYNPVSGKWQLSKDDLSYFYSSARFYETSIDEFGFLNNIFSYFSGG
jgi:REP element-mobilizing transposase RayT